MKYSVLLGLSLLVFAAPALADEDTAPAITSADLAAYNLTDAQIAERCKTAIAQKLDMVETEDGRHITSCVNTYEIARSVVGSYNDTETNASAMIQTHNCDTETTQEKCLASGRDLATDALKAHQSMQSNAQSGEERLVQLVGTNDSN